MYRVVRIIGESVVTLAKTDSWAAAEILWKQLRGTGDVRLMMAS